MAENLEKKAPNVRFKGFTYDWELRKLKGIASFSKGNGYSKKSLLENGNPIILYGQLYTNYQTIISEVNTFAKVNEKSVISSGGEVIVPASGETPEDISRASVVRESGIILGGDLNVIKPFKFLTPPFLALTISNGASKNQMVRRAQGKSIVHLHNSDLKQIKLFIPKINEQKKISSFFQKLDTLLVLYQRKIGLLQQLKKAMLQRLFPDTDTYPKLRFGGFSGPWEQHNLGKVADRFDNLRIPVAESKRISGDIPYYGANGIQDYVKGFTHDGEFLLIAEDGASDLKNYPVNYVNGKVWVNNHAHVISAKNTHADNKFLMNAIKRINFETYIVGGSRSKLNADTMMKLPVKIPKINEQKQIGDFFVKLDTLIALQQRKLDNMNKLKKFMLQQMFI